MNRIIDIIADQYAYDVAVLTEPWMYYPLLIPALCYLPFMLMKWVMLTCPLWIPLTVLSRGREVISERESK